MTKKEIDMLKIWSKTHNIINGDVVLNPESAVKYLDNNEYYLNKILKKEKIFLTSNDLGFKINEDYISFTTPKYKETEPVKLKIKYKDILKFNFL